MHTLLVQNSVYVYSRINKNVAESKNFTEREITSRATHLALYVFQAYFLLKDLAIGLFATVATLSTLGTNKKYSALFYIHFPVIAHAPTHLYFNFLRIVNPKASMDDSDGKFELSNGFICKKIAPNFLGKLATSDTFLKKEIYSRLCVLPLLIISTIGRIADIALSLIAVPFSAITLGAFRPLNNIACATLQGPGGIIFDIVTAIFLLINPQTFVFEKKKSDLQQPPLN